MQVLVFSVSASFWKFSNTRLLSTVVEIFFCRCVLACENLSPVSVEVHQMKVSLSKVDVNAEGSFPDVSGAFRKLSGVVLDQIRQLRTNSDSTFSFLCLLSTLKGSF